MLPPSRVGCRKFKFSSLTRLGEHGRYAAVNSMNEMNPYQTPTAGETNKASPCKKRRFEFVGQLEYADTHKPDQNRSAQYWGNLYTMAAIPVMFVLFIALKVNDGHTLLSATKTVLFHPLVLIGFLVVLSIYTMSKWFIIQAKKRSEKGDGEFSETHYRIDDNSFRWKTKVIETKLGWEAIDHVLIADDQIQLVLAQPNFGSMIIPKRWFESNLEDWDELKKFATEKTSRNAA